MQEGGEKGREKIERKKHANVGWRVTLGACTPYPEKVWERGQKAKGQNQKRKKMMKIRL